MIFKALDIFDVIVPQDVDRLRGVVEQIYQDMQIQGLWLAQVTENTEEFSCITQLHGTEYHNLGNDCHEAFSILMQFPRVAYIFRNQQDQCFLQHLLAQYLAVVYSNSFEIQVAGVKMCNLYHTLSFFNHSCSPNVLHIIVGNKMHLIAARNINQNEELFIGYKAFSEEISTVERRQALMVSWNFHCNCVRCQEPQEITNTLIRLQTAALKRNYATFMQNLRTGPWNLNIGAQIIAYQLLIREKI